MLKRNWNWRNNRLFCHIFDIGEISIGRGPCPPSPCLRLCSKWGKQKRCSQIFREVSVVFQQNFNCSKNRAVLEPRTGQFSRTWGFEAKAKDLRLRGQGQGRPRGLHLWLPQCTWKFPLFPISLLHSLVLNVANLRILYDLIIVGDIRSWVSTPLVFCFRLWRY